MCGHHLIFDMGLAHSAQPILDSDVHRFEENRIVDDMIDAVIADNEGHPISAEIAQAKPNGLKKCFS
jgi:hypothetical protein